MSRLTEAHMPSLVDACQAHAADVASDLHASLGVACLAGRCDAVTWSPDALPALFDRPGLAIALDLGDPLDPRQAVFLLPQSPGVPEWARAPSPTQSSRLAAMARDWAKWLLPPEIQVTAIHVVGVEGLRGPLSVGDPPEWARVVRFTFLPAEGTNGVATELALAAPLRTPVFVADQPHLGLASPAPAATAAETSTRPDPAFDPHETTTDPFDIDPTADDASDLPGDELARELEARARVRRLLQLPVTVTVRLAQKRIELKQLLAIGPGALLTFNKPCEELLDLYVNNRRYCRGEAVKIGEKFGLKIEEVGVEEVRVSKVV